MLLIILDRSKTLYVTSQAWETTFCWEHRHSVSLSKITTTFAGGVFSNKLRACVRAGRGTPSGRAQGSPCGRSGRRGATAGAPTLMSRWRRSPGMSVAGAAGCMEMRRAGRGGSAGRGAAVLGAVHSLSASWAKEAQTGIHTYTYRRRLSGAPPLARLTARLESSGQQASTSCFPTQPHTHTHKTRFQDGIIPTLISSVFHFL